MGQKIEIDPFLRQDIMEIVHENSTALFTKGGDETKCLTINRYDAAIEAILEKVTEFVNENYTIKD
jgi:hypothetical protein